MARWLKISLIIFASLVLFFIVVLAGLSIYISSHKTKVIAMVTAELNKNLDGKLTVGDVKTSLFERFPSLSVKLENVSLRDKQFERHHHTLLNTRSFDVAVNFKQLLKGNVNIDHIDITGANIDLFTDSSGYTNTSIFKKDTTKANKGTGKNDLTQIGKFNLKEVIFTVDDRKAKKLFKFEVERLNGKINFPDTGWAAETDLKVMARSMAFSTVHGSFIKNKLIEGRLKGGYNSSTGVISVRSDDFSIGGDDFNVTASFNTKKKPADFTFFITADQLLWRHASSLLAPNISQKLNLFNLDKPIAITATIKGTFGPGDPFLYITAGVNNNKLSGPGWVIDDVSFKGVFTNNYIKGKGFTDANSIIRLSAFQGSYGHLPFVIDTGSIINLEKPIATGNFKSNFPATNFNYLFGSSVARFSKGTADMTLHYKADIVDYLINKPIVTGDINLRNADINYVPRNIAFKNTSVSFHFTKKDLTVDHIRVQSGRSVVLMKGRINNFLNLYYNAPEKIVIDWQINSPQLYIGEFIGFLGTRQHVETKKVNRRNSGNIVDQLGTVLDKAQAAIHINAANVHYNKFLATDAVADLHLSDDGVQISNASVKHAGGSLKLRGNIYQDKTQNHFNLNTTVNNVNVREFFLAFDNFGLTDITYQNLKGFLSSTTKITGRLSNAGGLVPLSIFGTSSINLQNAALLNYKPLINVGKFAFPFRNLREITIPRLDANFEIRGDKIVINPMQLNSSVLNADIAGTYGLKTGTDITMDVPLRNPKNDADITDSVKLAKRRNRGVVLHIRASDDESGKLKIGWNKDHKILGF
ncbi:AsmA family protein [Mucilaginibacter xinganensis]|uniref:AsmA family protein n=1 Tax=Mucilaginibacter xinganensis TaxID=1234841 RepID=A0A223NV59_9SPHI|nr:AsmA family protein [Mucilaginibacter xinganensis]ASU33726.1 AsmA family protein [Mucilaginibacter xinganensis]